LPRTPAEATLLAGLLVAEYAIVPVCCGPPSLTQDASVRAKSAAMGFDPGMGRCGS
jgi:hypothetical protein